MHIALVHNKDAGSGVHSGNDLVSLLRDSGHVVELFGTDHIEVLRALQIQPEVLVVSGGDGTVAKVVIAACGTDVPLFILPSGTSNNIARAIGADADIPSLIGRMSNVRLSRLDVGCIAGDGQTTNFVEAAGAGFMGAMLTEGRRPTVRLVSAVRGMISLGRNHWASTAERVAEHVRSELARGYNIIADGKDLSGEYIAVEAMNIASIGPRIPLAPDADPSDGQLDLVLARPMEREALASYIESLGTTSERPPLTVHRVRTVEMNWPSSDAHVDDELWLRPARVKIDLAGYSRLLVAAR